MINNKKAQGLSVNAIILIVLGVVILVVLIAGFTVGWQKFLPFLSTSNVDTVMNSCSVACSTGNQFDFCIAKRDLNAGSTKLKAVTCNYLSKEQNSYGISTCSEIACDGIEFGAANQADAKIKCGEAGNSQKLFQYLNNSELRTFECATGKEI